MVVYFYFGSMVALYGAVVLLALAASGCAGGSAAAPLVYWHGAADGVQAPQSLGPPVGQRGPASGGAFLTGYALQHKDNTASYEFELPRAIDAAQIIFRYGRQHWRSTMVPARFAMQVINGGQTIQAEAVFADTRGWGYKPSDWQLAAFKLGSLKAGPCSVKLLSLSNNNDVCMDGFFIASPDLNISAAELALSAVTVTSDGYVGLQSATTVRQDLEPTLCVAARSFSNKTPQVTLAIGKTAESAMPLKPAGTDTGKDGAILAKFQLPRLDDGNYVVVVNGQWPRCRAVAPVFLVGQFLSSLDKRMQPLEAFTAELAKSSQANDVRCLADFQELVEYVQASSALLGRASSAGARGSLQTTAGGAEGIVLDASSLVQNVHRALLQGEETMQRLQAGRDPYAAGHVGDLRRAYRSAASGELRVYRLAVPSAYDKADKVPLILMLHGGDGAPGDENLFPDFDGGKLLETLDQRGYLVVCPRCFYKNGLETVTKDLAQLIDLLRKEFPKIDPARIYCTGASRGGFETCDMATTYPDLFAAICCVSGVGRPELAEKLRTVPTLILQGGQDAVVVPDGAKKLAARMKELGETVELHIFPSYGHTYQGQEYLKLTLDFFDQHSK